MLINEQINTNTSYHLGTEAVDRMPDILFVGVNRLTESHVQGGFCGVEEEAIGRKSRAPR